MKTINVKCGSFRHGEEKKIVRVSRWIKVKQAYDITPRHSLYDYAIDENGSHISDLKRECNYLDYFVFRGRKYAIEQFISCGFCGYFYTDENDKECYIGYYDGDGCLYNPLMIECDEYGEYIRCYEEI